MDDDKGGSMRGVARMVAVEEKGMRFASANLTTSP